MNLREVLRLLFLRYFQINYVAFADVTSRWQKTITKYTADKFTGFNEFIQSTKYNFFKKEKKIVVITIVVVILLLVVTVIVVENNTTSSSNSVEYKRTSRFYPDSTKMLHVFISPQLNFVQKPEYAKEIVIVRDCEQLQQKSSLHESIYCLHEREVSFNTIK